MKFDRSGPRLREIKVKETVADRKMSLGHFCKVGCQGEVQLMEGLIGYDEIPGVYLAQKSRQTMNRKSKDLFSRKKTKGVNFTKKIGFNIGG